MEQANAPLVSVVVPVFNQAQYLSACLDSLWHQDYGQLEIIVVNDGSTDDTAHVLARYQERLTSDTTSFASRFEPDTDTLVRQEHARYPAAGRALRILTHPGNQGLAGALNTGARAARGVYCTYVPADDWCFPDMISELAGALARGFDFAFADMLITNDRFEVVRRFNLPEYSFERSFADWYLCGVCKLYRRELHERLGFYDETLLAHDHELFQRFALGGASFIHVDKALMAVRDHAGREKDIHNKDNWSRLIGESKQLVMQARRQKPGDETLF